MFIRRPVLSLVISLIITLLGVLALFKLPITQFPDIVPPSVVVTANYNGANAEVCAKAVATIGKGYKRCSGNDLYELSKQ